MERFATHESSSFTLSCCDTETFHESGDGEPAHWQSKVYEYSLTLVQSCWSDVIRVTWLLLKAGARAEHATYARSASFLGLRDVSELCLCGGAAAHSLRRLSRSGVPLMLIAFLFCRD